MIFHQMVSIPQMTTFHSKSLKYLVGRCKTIVISLEIKEGGEAVGKTIIKQKNLQGRKKDG